MNTYRIVYVTEDGYKDEVVVSAANSIAAALVFEDIAKDFDEEVVSAECFRIIENEVDA